MQSRSRWSCLTLHDKPKALRFPLPNARSAALISRGHFCRQMQLKRPLSRVIAVLRLRSPWRLLSDKPPPKVELSLADVLVRISHFAQIGCGYRLLADTGVSQRRTSLGSEPGD
eukprot:scaffold4081_cov268-Pinguiococcus_pyrenoidosus.AAC.10